MPDSTTTLADLRTAVATFVAERDWAQFHNAKDLAVSICLEAAELLEEFQWHDAAQVAAAGSDPEVGSGCGWSWPISSYTVCV